MSDISTYSKFRIHLTTLAGNDAAWEYGPDRKRFTTWEGWGGGAVDSATPGLAACWVAAAARRTKPLETLLVVGLKTGMVGIVGRCSG